ncbi:MULTISPECIES: hypothetical protein [Chromobacterium]|uniref:hypothetical protein n=1 Tax=Chromobacterium TaxID=535 RepID=UPI0009D9EE32|nr:MULTISPECIES: hypothetical protein [Chromobacterium]OQS34738.1 hypothetical protein B0T39_19125 [Chromobacterium haemolyticum]
MAEQPTSKPSLSANMAVVIGRIKAVRKSDDFVHTEVIQPAPDEYSMPGVVEVRSRKRLGDIGQDVHIKVQCTGYYGKPFDSKDKVTGEIVKKRAVINVFSAIED